ncbi:hypothetical protein L1987_00982 [Smallanthus sonchifolius]|uniref:Uncharacterized protein n=1 Tax=Smallanthus sonchifolius TaxID=185202 RepID=A0ACB9K3U5_9ASTR|nr:hypothetical protein L1987_00982 [Smallanthus sonchifolius]
MGSSVAYVLPHASTEHDRDDEPGVLPGNTGVLPRLAIKIFGGIGVIEQVAKAVQAVLLGLVAELKNVGETAKRHGLTLDKFDDLKDIDS